MSKGIPSSVTWIAYIIFFISQIVLAAFVPGVTIDGVPTAPYGKRLPYLCNGYLCYYFSILGYVSVHYFGIYSATHLIDNYGEYLIASIILGDLSSLFWYLYGFITTDEQNVSDEISGNVIYDFFMGTTLYPRIGIVDIKMVAEARWSWLTLMLLTLSCAFKQYDQIGYISKEMGMMVYAHWLYSNATVKGEQYIPCTWDMFHERFGWMLCFWNVTGVPFLYCFQSYFLLKHNVSHSNLYAVAVYLVLTLGYYIFDSANCQKASVKLPGVPRNTFPKVPWAILTNPKFLKTPKGDLLIDGWYAYARKMQYTGDILMALSWGLICGFSSSMPYFYALFFTCMILHRQVRDEYRCRAKYGDDWTRYTSKVPNVFVPSLSFFTWLFTGKQNDGGSSSISSTISSITSSDVDKLHSE